LFANELLPKSVFRLVTIRGQLSHDFAQRNRTFLFDLQSPIVFTRMQLFDESVQGASED